MITVQVFFHFGLNVAFTIYLSKAGLFFLWFKLTAFLRFGGSIGCVIRANASKIAKQFFSCVLCLWGGEFFYAPIGSWSRCSWLAATNLF
jgi:hypothetical protein